MTSLTTSMPGLGSTIRGEVRSFSRVPMAGPSPAKASGSVSRRWLVWNGTSISSSEPAATLRWPVHPSRQPVEIARNPLRVTIEDRSSTCRRPSKGSPAGTVSILRPSAFQAPGPCGRWPRSPGRFPRCGGPRGPCRRPCGRPRDRWRPRSGRCPYGCPRIVPPSSVSRGPRARGDPAMRLARSAYSSRVEGYTRFRESQTFGRIGTGRTRGGGLGLPRSCHPPSTTRGARSRRVGPSSLRTASDAAPASHLRIAEQAGVHVRE